MSATELSQALRSAGARLFGQNEARDKGLGVELRRFQDRVQSDGAGRALELARSRVNDKRGRDMALSGDVRLHTTRSETLKDERVRLNASGACTTHTTQQCGQ
jgi:hypothetical protein